MNLAATILVAYLIGSISFAVLVSRAFGLLEKLAEHVAELVQREFKSPWVKVSVTKLAPLRNVRRLGVTIERGSKQ